MLRCWRTPPRAWLWENSEPRRSARKSCCTRWRMCGRSDDAGLGPPRECSEEVEITLNWGAASCATTGADSIRLANTSGLWREAEGFVVGVKPHGDDAGAAAFFCIRGIGHRRKWADRDLHFDAVVGAAGRAEVQDF